MRKIAMALLMANGLLAGCALTEAKEYEGYEYGYFDAFDGYGYHLGYQEAWYYHYSCY